MSLSRRALIVGGVAAGLTTAWAGQAVAAASPVLFVVAHPDDETLAMSVAIAEHVAAGQDVHLLIMSAGEGSKVRDRLNGSGVASYWGRVHSPAVEGYSPLSVADFAAARQGETIRAVAQLASPGTVTMHLESLPDGGVTQAAAHAVILELADQIAPAGPVRLKAHSYLAAVEAHPDHRAVGSAVVQLANEAPARFGDRRHYVLPQYWGYSGTLPSKVWDNPASTDIKLRVRNAIRSFGAWAPPLSYAIGRHSVSSSFSKLDAAPKCLTHK